MTAKPPAAEVGLAADILLVSNPLPRDRAVAELLAAIAGTWETQPNFVRDHALNIARTVPTAAEASSALCDTCGHSGLAHPKGGFCVGQLPYGGTCGCDDYEPAAPSDPGTTA